MKKVKLSKHQKGIVCQYCDSKTEKKTDIEVYGKEFFSDSDKIKFFAVCTNDLCGAYVGCETNTFDIPMDKLDSKFREMLMNKDCFFIPRKDVNEKLKGLLIKVSKPYGTTANAELRRFRILCHKYFDKLWKTKVKIIVGNKFFTQKRYKELEKKCRLDAYHWLSSKLEKDIRITHIAMFSLNECYKVLSFCFEHYKDENITLSRFELETIRLQANNNQEQSSLFQPTEYINTLQAQ